MLPNKLSQRGVIASVALCLTVSFLAPAPALSKWGIPLPFGKKKSDDSQPARPKLKDMEEPDNEEPPPKPDKEEVPPGLRSDEPAAEADMQGEGDEDSEEHQQDMSKNAGEDEAPLDVIESDPELHYKLAKQLVAKKKLPEALQEINKCLQLNKDYWDARYLGAYIYQLQDRVPESIHRYQDYVKHKPDDLQAHINLGVMLRKAGQDAEAEDQYRKAIDIKFYSLEAHYNLANVLIGEEKFEDALKELRVCLKIAPANAWVHNNLGVIYQKRNYLEEAADEFLRALNLEPANKVFEKNLAMVRQQLKKKPVKA
jgi:Flp pilus assembly protein TadD